MFEEKLSHAVRFGHAVWPSEASYILHVYFCAIGRFTDGFHVSALWGIDPARTWRRSSSRSKTSAGTATSRGACT